MKIVRARALCILLSANTVSLASHALSVCFVLVQCGAVCVGVVGRRESHRPTEQKAHVAHDQEADFVNNERSCVCVQQQQYSRKSRA